MMLRHIPLDVLNHDNGVVDHHTNRQDQAEQREQIDRKAERQHARERRDQRDDDRNAADDGCPKALQEEVNHQNNQDDGFGQSLQHLLDREPDEIIGVERDHIIHALGEARLHLLQCFADSLRHDETVGSRLLVHGDERRRDGIQTGIDDILLKPDLGASDIADPHDGAPVLAGAQNDVEVFARFGVLRLRHHWKGELNGPGVRLLADLAGSE